jgi:biopolymer transport protein ExbD
MLRFLFITLTAFLLGCGSTSAPKQVAPRKDVQEVEVFAKSQGGVKSIKLNGEEIGSSLGALEAQLAGMAKQERVKVRLRVDETASYDTVINCLRTCAGTKQGDEFVRHASAVEIGVSESFANFAPSKAQNESLIPPLHCKIKLRNGGIDSVQLNENFVGSVKGLHNQLLSIIGGQGEDRLLFKAVLHFEDEPSSQLLEDAAGAALGYRQQDQFIKLVPYLRVEFPDAPMLDVTDPLKR